MSHLRYALAAWGLSAVAALAQPAVPPATAAGPPPAPPLSAYGALPAVEQVTLSPDGRPTSAWSGRSGR